MGQFKFEQRWKKVPTKVTKLLGIMYGTKDKENRICNR
jgi:hypothetical protein